MEVPKIRSITELCSRLGHAVCLDSRSGQAARTAFFVTNLIISPGSRSISALGIIQDKQEQKLIADRDLTRIQSLNIQVCGWTLNFRCET
jgi:hypothetical protein